MADQVSRFHFRFSTYALLSLQVDQSSLGLFATVLREDGSEVKTCLECVNREQKHFKRPNCDWPLDFGSQKVIRFSTGEAKIGFRIICYCKHHGQKIGFR